MRHRLLSISSSALLLLLTGLVAPPASASRDAAFVHAVDSGLSRASSQDLEKRLDEGLRASTAVRLMPASSVAGRLLGGEDPARLVSGAEELLRDVRARLAARDVSGDPIGDLDDARGMLLRSTPSEPRMDLVREYWALRGLAAFLEGDERTAAIDFERLFETDPTFRADPRLYPPEVREEMGRVLMRRSASVWRVLASYDVSEIGEFLGAHYVIVAHLRDTGLDELEWRVDLFDVGRGEFASSTEVHFVDRSDERAEAVGKVVRALAEEMSGTHAPVGAVSKAEPAPPAPTPSWTEPAPPASAPKHAPAPAARWTAPEPSPAPPPPARDAFQPLEIVDDWDDDGVAPVARERRSTWGWWVGAAVVAAAAGGAAVVFGMDQAPSESSLSVRVHPR